jgi:hypothetical protein
MLCCFCENYEDDWQHVLSCPGTGTIINRTESCESLKLEHKQFNIQEDIWKAIGYGINFFNNHQEREGSPGHTSLFPGTMQLIKIHINNAFASQTKYEMGKTPSPKTTRGHDRFI